jgi:hypothetical protein
MQTIETRLYRPYLGSPFWAVISKIKPRMQIGRIRRKPQGYVFEPQMPDWHEVTKSKLRTVLECLDLINIQRNDRGF